MDFSFTQDIILENDRVLLRPLQISDVKNLLAAATEDKTLVQYSPMQIYTEPLLKHYIENALKDREGKLRYPFITFDKLKNEYAGSTSFMHVSNKDKRIEIGATWMGRQFQKTGLNRNCKYLMLNYVFGTLEFERLEFVTDERNQASRKAIEAIGGKLEGILRSHTLMSDGFRRNTAIYSILRSEWPEVKKRFKNIV